MSLDRRHARVTLLAMAKAAKDEAEEWFFTEVANLLDDAKPVEPCGSFPPTMGAGSAFSCEIPKGHRGPCCGAGRFWVPV